MRRSRSEFAGLRPAVAGFGTAKAGLRLADPRYAEGSGEARVASATQAEDFSAKCVRTHSRILRAKTTRPESVGAVVVLRVRQSAEGASADYRKRTAPLIVSEQNFLVFHVKQRDLAFTQPQ